VVEVGVVNPVKAPTVKGNIGRDWNVGIGGKIRKVMRNINILLERAQGSTIVPTSQTQVSSGGSIIGGRKIKSGGMRI